MANCFHQIIYQPTDNIGSRKTLFVNSDIMDEKINAIRPKGPFYDPQDELGEEDWSGLEEWEMEAANEILDTFHGKDKFDAWSVWKVCDAELADTVAIFDALIEKSIPRGKKRRRRN